MLSHRVLPLLLAGVLIAARAPQNDAPAAEPQMPKTYAGTVNAPDFPQGLDWLNTDHPLSLKDLRGKVVLLDFWTYGCINCMHIIPDLKRLEQKYGDALVVIGVHSAKFANEKGTEKIRQAVLRYDLRHPVINDKDFVVWSAYGAEAWPTLVIIDPEGKAAASWAGEGIYDPFDKYIGAMIARFDAEGKINRTPLALHLEKDKVPQTLLSFPGKLAIDEKSGRLAIADSDHNRIVIVSPIDGAVQEVIGEGSIGLKDGAFDQAQFHRPQGLTFDGNILYVADTENHAIRKVDLAQKTVTTLAGTGHQAVRPNVGGRGREVDLTSPWDVLVHDGKLYIAMAGSHQLWTLNLATLDAEPYAGSAAEGLDDGPLASASLAQPSGMSLDAQTGRLYFADSEASAIRYADVKSGGRVHTIVGHGLFDFGDRDGAASSAILQHPLAVLYHQGKLYVADTYNSKIKRIDLATNDVHTIAGTGIAGLVDGPGAQAQFSEPSGLALVGEEKLYIADTNNHQIRILDLSSGNVSTLPIRQAEKLVNRSAADAFASAPTLRLPPQSVAPGAGSLDLSVLIPKGYKLNDAAPFFIAVRSGPNGAASVPADWRERNIDQPMFPLKVPVSFSPGKAELTADLVIYYCRADQESVCLVKQLRVLAPVEVKAEAQSHAVSIAAPVTPGGAGQ